METKEQKEFYVTVNGQKVEVSEEVLRYRKRAEGGGQRRGISCICAPRKSAATHGKTKQKMQSERRAAWACAL